MFKTLPESLIVVLADYGGHHMSGFRSGESRHLNARQDTMHENSVHKLSKRIILDTIIEVERHYHAPEAHMSNVDGTSKR
jgi:hypothetical protein